ncbi:hypothetical protein CIB48_g2067 [Xylaria polymorpha]|nr:hypothetical protein CIB48_g2067 [Xylaria polymorpha]
MKSSTPLFEMHRPHEKRRRRRSLSCPPNLRLCIELGTKPRGHITARQHFTGQPNIPHSREDTSTHAHHNAATSRGGPVRIPEGGLGQHPHVKNGLPYFGSRAGGRGYTVGIGPYWNPPRNPAPKIPAPTTCAPGPKMTDCEWMRPDPVATTTTTKTPASTSASEEPGWAGWGDSLPASKRQHRPCPREAWSDYDGSCPSDTPRCGRSAQANHGQPNSQNSTSVTAMIRYRGHSDGSISPPYSEHEHSGHTVAAWDPFWNRLSAIDHEI